MHGHPDASARWSGGFLERVTSPLTLSDFWPDVEVVGTTTYLTWIRDGTSHVGGVWTGAYASPANLPRPQILVGLVPRAGKATALNVSVTSRLYATTET